MLFWGFAFRKNNFFCVRDGVRLLYRPRFDSRTKQQDARCHFRAFFGSKDNNCFFQKKKWFLKNILRKHTDTKTLAIPSLERRSTSFSRVVFFCPRCSRKTCGWCCFSLAPPPPPVRPMGCAVFRLFFLCGWCWCPLLLWVVVPLDFFLIKCQLSWETFLEQKHNKLYFLWKQIGVGQSSIKWSGVVVPQSSFCVVLLPSRPYVCGVVLPSPPSFWVVLHQWFKVRAFQCSFLHQKVFGHHRKAVELKNT